jgi:hypothetical protein
MYAAPKPSSNPLSSSLGFPYTVNFVRSTMLEFAQLLPELLQMRYRSGGICVPLLDLNELVIIGSKSL